jgi:hypothetical protein
LVLRFLNCLQHILNSFSIFSVVIHFEDSGELVQINN